MESWIWITRWFLICFRFLRLHWLYDKKHETITTAPRIHFYINRINNRLAFKIKDGYKLELKTPKTMKLCGSTKKLIDKTKNGENVPSLDVVAVVLVDNQYQQIYEVLYTFMLNKSYAYLLNRHLEIEDKVNLTLLIKK